MKEQKDRIAAVFTTNRHPLLDASYGNVTFFINTLCRVNGMLPRIALPQERKCLVELSIFVINAWGCGRRRLVCGSLPKRPRTHAEERKVTSKDVSGHKWLLVRDLLIPHNILRNGWNASYGALGNNLQTG